MAPVKQKKIKQTNRNIQFDEKKYKHILEREPVAADDPCPRRREQVRKEIDVALGIRRQAKNNCRFPMNRVIVYFTKKRERLRAAGMLVGDSRYRHTEEQSTTLRNLIEAGEQEWTENIESVVQEINLTTKQARDFKYYIENTQKAKKEIMEGTMKKKLRAHSKTVRKDEDEESESDEIDNDSMEEDGQESEAENDPDETNDAMEVVPEDGIPDQLDQGNDQNEDVVGEDIPIEGEEEIGQIIRQDPDLREQEPDLKFEQDLDFEPMIDDFEFVDGNDLQQAPVEDQDFVEKDNNDISMEDANPQLPILQTSPEKRVGEPIEELARLKIAEEESMSEHSPDIPLEGIADVPEDVPQEPEPVDTHRPQLEHDADGQDRQRSTHSHSVRRFDEVFPRSSVVYSTLNGRNDNPNWFTNFLNTALAESDESDDDDEPLTQKEKVRKFRTKVNKCLADALGQEYCDVSNLEDSDDEDDEDSNIGPEDYEKKS